MNRRDLNEAVSILTLQLNAILGLLRGQDGLASAKARTLIGEAIANAGQDIGAATVGAKLFACFEQARILGATRVQMDSIRKLMLTQAPQGLAAVAIAISGVYFSLIEQAQIIAATTFVSHADVDALLVTMNAAFEPAEEFAGDATDDPSLYQAIVALHSNITRDLIARARPLPRLVSYSFSIVQPALVLAQRLYQDPSRAEDLVAENRIVHPAFMPMQGRCLSNVAT